MHKVAIIGGGPAGLIAAYELAAHAEVHLYEAGRTVGRKFLVAGEGGLNITNSVLGDALTAHYTPAELWTPLLSAFGPEELRQWLAELGVPTFVGSSGRVFPQRGIKPAEVLKAITAALVAKGVRIHTEHRFLGFDEMIRPIIQHAEERIILDAARVLFALGGASWPKTGSTGDWVAHFEAIGVRTLPFQASNCGVEADMPQALQVHAGKPLKNIAVHCGEHSVRGEATITEHGLEGNAIYPIIPAVRAVLDGERNAEIIIDLKPDLSEEQIEQKLRDVAWKERMARLRLDRPAVALLKAFTPMMRYLDGSTLAYDVKHVRVPVRCLRPIAEAISTVGGIALDEVSTDLSLKKHPHIFVAGEMLDWDAPTGGFLLQGAFSSGRWAAEGMR